MSPGQAPGLRIPSAPCVHTSKLPPVTGVGSVALRVWSRVPRSACLWEQPSPRMRGSWCANTLTPCSSKQGLSGTGCSWTLGSPHGGEVLLAHTGDWLLSALLVPLTPDQSSLRSPLRSLSCIQSFASTLASGGTLPRTVDLGLSF